MKKQAMGVWTPAAVLVGVAGLGLLASASWGQIQWSSGAPSPVFEFEQLRANLVKAGTKGEHVVVRLTRPITDEGRQVLARAGLTVLAPVGDLCFFAALAGGRVDDGALAASGWLAGAVRIQPQWKVHRDFLNGVTQPWTIVEQGEDPMIAVYVTMFDDVPQDIGAQAVVEHKGVVVGRMASMNMIVAHVPRSAVMSLASDDAIQWIEPAAPRMQELNAENRALTGANSVQAAPYNLNGTGVVVFVFDGGKIRTTHQDLSPRVTLIPGDGSTTSSHATHVAGTVGGAGNVNFNNRGMAPGVTFLSAGVEISGQTGWLYSNPVDVERDYGVAYDMGAHIATNSIGTNIASNGFDCGWEGDYHNTDILIDTMVRGNSTVTDNNPFRIVWAAGNERGNGRCGTTYGTIGPPGGAKNHLSIGAVNANDDSMTTFSGWGPTDDGRMKPDFCAPGCQVGGDGGVTSTTSTSDTSYGSLCGTSMATPTVTGCASLLLEDYRALFPGAPDPRNSTLKVLFAQSAVDRGLAGPDYQFGYGSIRIQQAIDLMRTGNFREETVSQGVDQFFQVVVPSGATELKITLAWDDQPGTPNAIRTLVNDLDLEVFAPGGARAFPWTLNPAFPALPAVQTQRNSLDNIEQVYVQNPEAGVWSVRVHAFNVPAGPQVFSIVSSHTLMGGTPFPAVTISNVSTPDVLFPANAETVQATVNVQNDTLVPGSVRVYYRSQNTGPFSFVEMMNVGGNVWEATIPGFSCNARPQFYYAAEGQSAGVVHSPPAGPAAPYSAVVGEYVVFFVDDMEIDRGWTVGPNTATTGIWNRMDPQGTAAQPEDDTTPAPGVNCWVTDGNAGTGVGTFDVDGGFTTLTSPPINLAGQPEAVIGYSRWYSNTAGASPNADVFVVQISGDGTTWVPLETVGPTGTGTSGGWFFPSFRVGDFITPTSTVRLRFIAEDANAGSIVEAAVDDLFARIFQCLQAPCDADVNCDGSVDGFDVEVMEQAVGGDVTNFCQPDDDFNHDGSVDGFDVEAVEQVVGGLPCP
jgi:hypothetical protein